MTKISEERIERAARAICLGQSCDPDGMIEGMTAWEFYTHEARVALTADTPAIVEAERNLRKCEINKSELWKVVRGDAEKIRQLKARIEELENVLDWFADENGDGAQRDAARLLAARLAELEAQSKEPTI